jgi:hypothetical protein
MELRDSEAFMEMLVFYRRMWVRYQVMDALYRNPHANQYKIIDWAEEVATEGLKPVFDALEQGRDVLDALREATKAVAPPVEPLSR